jgi:HAD superfamily hydrolase (TIGR01509 family)
MAQTSDVFAGPPRGLITDWGGVITDPLPAALAVWARSEGLDPDAVMSALTGFIEGEANLLQALERGEVARPDVEPWLADAFAACGPRPDHDGLFERMFAPLQTDRAALDLVRRARSTGLRTALLSNSWGDAYQRDGWDEAFDAVVISEDVGMRKPEPAIFAHVCQLIDLPPSACVFVDDEPINVIAARELGFRVVHHDPDDPQRLARLAAVLDLTLEQT